MLKEKRNRILNSALLHSFLCPLGVQQFCLMRAVCSWHPEWFIGGFISFILRGVLNFAIEGTPEMIDSLSSPVEESRFKI